MISLHEFEVSSLSVHVQEVEGLLVNADRLDVQILEGQQTGVVPQHVVLQNLLVSVSGPNRVHHLTENASGLMSNQIQKIITQLKTPIHSIY